VILLVVGTYDRPFPRAVQLASKLTRPDEPLVVQHGHTTPVATVTAQWRQWYSRAELDELMRAARIVVVHGGSGCIVGAQRQGVRPVVVPRLARYGEHVDDHQTQLSKRLEPSQRVVVWHEGESAETVAARHACEVDGGESFFGPGLRPAVWAAARAMTRTR
jgi:UDP-N-acetylglucosamine transferase subunit ALG13